MKKKRKENQIEEDGIIKWLLEMDGEIEYIFY